MPDRQRKVLVIGAGLAGLSAAAHLLAAGHQVRVIEAAATPGGLVRTERLSGHAFDTGATVLTMPELIVDILGLLGVDEARATERLGLRPVEPSYVMNYADGTSLTIPRERSAIPDAVGAALGSDAGRGTAALLDWLRKVYDAEYEVFIDRNFASMRELTDRRTLRAAMQLMRLRTLGGLTGAVRRFTADERLQRAFTFQALYAGLPPERARAIYSIIAEMDIGRGLSAPAGGMGRIGQVLADAVTDAGGLIDYRVRATRIDTADGTVRTVHTDDGRVLRADAVIASLERDRVADLLGTRIRRRLRYSPSAVVVHGVLPVGTTDSWRSGHHTLDFGAAWRRTFAELTRFGSIMSDGSFLITRGAVTDPETFIRDGAESVSILAPTPNLATARIDWRAIAAPYVTEFLRTLDTRGYRGLSDLDVLRIDHPGTWLADGLPAGTPFSAAHTLTQTGPLRTRNRWPGLSNLFLAGSATVPGVGIPPVLVSGGLAAARVNELIGGAVPSEVAR